MWVLAMGCLPCLPIWHVSDRGAFCVQNGGQPTFDVRAQFARYALTQPQAVADRGRFNTTELHCTEYYPGVTAGLPRHLILHDLDKSCHDDDSELA